MGLDPVIPSYAETFHLLVSAAIEHGWFVKDIVLGGSDEAEWPNLRYEAPPGALAAGDLVAFRPDVIHASGCGDVLVFTYNGAAPIDVELHRIKGGWDDPWDEGLHLPLPTAVTLTDTITVQPLVTAGELLTVFGEGMCYVQVDNTDPFTPPLVVPKAAYWGYGRPAVTDREGPYPYGAGPDPWPAVLAAELAVSPGAAQIFDDDGLPLAARSDNTAAVLTRHGGATPTYTMRPFWVTGPAPDMEKRISLPVRQVDASDSPTYLSHLIDLASTDEYTLVHTLALGPDSATTQQLLQHLGGPLIP